MRRATLLAGPTVVTGRPAVDRLGDVCGAADGDRPAELLFDARPQLHLGAAHRHGGMKLAVGQFRDVLRLAGDADVVLDQLVVGDQILVAERPVLAVPVERLALQVLLAEPIALPAPDVGASADHAGAALPAEWLVVRIGVRLLEVVGEPLVVPLAARVAVALLRTRPPHQVARLVAVLEVVCGNVLGEVLVALRLARFEQGHLDAGFRESLGRPATRGARSHHDHIELRRLHVDRLRSRARGSVARRRRSPGGPARPKTTPNVRRGECSRAARCGTRCRSSQARACPAPTSSTRPRSNP